MPTRRRPPSRAFFACAAAASRPFACGSERRTIVQPRSPAGHVIAAGFAGGGGGVVVLSRRRGRGRCRRRLRRGQRRRAAGDGQAAARRGRDRRFLLAVSGDRDRGAGAEHGDHETEQRRHEPRAGPVVPLGDRRGRAGDGTRRLVDEAVAALEAVLLTRLHRRVAARAAGLSRVAHRAFAGALATGRPHVAQKREPHSSGAPHSQRGGLRDARRAIRGAEEHVELVDPRLEPDQLGAALEQQVLAEAVAPVHLEREAAQVAELLLAQPQEGAALAPQLARRRCGTAARTGRLSAQQSWEAHHGAESRDRSRRGDPP